MSALVSVIMPVFNGEGTVEEAIKSILNQTYFNLELIICDDGSSDRTIEIVDKFSDNRIRILKNHNNEGNLYTTNRLLKEVKGDFIALQDADDYSVIDRLFKQVQIINEKNVDLVGTSVGLVLNSQMIYSIVNPSNHTDILKLMQQSPNVPIVWGSVLFKRKIFEDIGGFDPIFDRVGAADYNWLHRASLKYKFYNINDILYFYRQHMGSFTKSNNYINITKLYSEEIAFDIYQEMLNKQCYDFYQSKIIFEKRDIYYKDVFLKDQRKLLGVIYNQVVFNNLSLFEYFKEIYQVKSSMVIKFKYIIQGACVYFLGVKNLYNVKRIFLKGS